MNQITNYCSRGQMSTFKRMLTGAKTGANAVRDRPTQPDVLRSFALVSGSQPDFLRPPRTHLPYMACRRLSHRA
jgi:hypothetical protein